MYTLSRHSAPIELPVNPVITRCCNFASLPDFTATVLAVISCPTNKFTGQEVDAVTLVLTSLLDPCTYEDLRIAGAGIIIVRTPVGRAVVLSNQQQYQQYMLFSVCK